jgi:serine/threonine protein kinase
MILGQPYTQAADIWSAGVLLYAMVIGQLPFDHPSDVQDILRQIVRDEPQFPDILTSALIDLLRRLLAKAPEDRIRIDHIKKHPWFSQSEYVTIFQMRFSSDEWHMRGVDRAIIAELEKYGIDTRAVAEALLLGEWTPETAVYAMLHRRAITERIRETMDELKSNAGGMLLSSTIWASRAAAGELVTFKRGTSVVHKRAPTPASPAVMRPKVCGVFTRPKSTTLQ